MIYNNELYLNVLKETVKFMISYRLFQGYASASF